LLRRPDTRTETEQSQLTQVQQADPLLATIATHTEAFAQMVAAGEVVDLLFLFSEASVGDSVIVGDGLQAKIK